jgi:TolA-binding protein
MPAVLAACGLWLAMAPARAGLFDDDEARKAILDLRAKVSQNEQQLKQQADQIQSLQNSVLDLSNQNEQLRADLAKLRGQDEQMLRDMADLQRAMRDLQASLNDRMRKLEPQPVTVDGKTFTVDPEEKAAFEDAMNSLRGGDFDRAAASLTSLLKRFPSTGYGDARYWLGNAQYGQRDYKGSLATFKAFLAAAAPTIPARPRPCWPWPTARPNSRTPRRQAHPGGPDQALSADRGRPRRQGTPGGAEVSGRAGARRRPGAPLRRPAPPARRGRLCPAACAARGGGRGGRRRFLGGRGPGPQRRGHAGADRPRPGGRVQHQPADPGAGGHGGQAKVQALAQRIADIHPAAGCCRSRSSSSPPTGPRCCPSRWMC